MTSTWALLLFAALGGCSLPSPDGLEATLDERAAALAPLALREGTSPDAIVAGALLLDPEVRSKASDVSAGADEVRIQRAALFPALGLSIGGGIGAASRGDARLELRLRQLVFDGGATVRDVTLADIDLMLEYVAFQSAVDDSIVDALEAYDAVLSDVHLLSLRREQLAALQLLQTRVEERVEAGAAPRSDILETGIRLREAQFLVQDAELALGSSRDRLTRLTGQSRGGEVNLPSWSDCRSPDDPDAVRAAQLRLARATLALEEALAARQPGIFVEPVAGLRGGGESVGVGIDVSVQSDLLRGGALSAAVDAARAALVSAEADVVAARREDALESNRLSREISAAGHRADLLRAQIALLDETRQLYEAQYLELGTRRISELLDNEEAFYARSADLIISRSENFSDILACAIRRDAMRGWLGFEEVTLYGYPLGAPFRLSVEEGAAR